MKERRLSDNVVVEPATFADVSKIIELLSATQIQTYANVTSDLTKEVIRDHVESKKFQEKIIKRNKKRIKSRNALLLVARSENEIVGFASADIKKKIFRKEVHWNSGLYIKQDHQGKGIGTALTNERLKWHGPVDVFLYVVPGTPADIFHENFGFKPTGVKTISTYTTGHNLPLIEMKLAKSGQHFVSFSRK